MKPFLFFMISGATVFASVLEIQLDREAGQIEVFFTADPANQYQLWRGSNLDNFTPIESFSGVSGTIRRLYPVPSLPGFFKLEYTTPVPPLPGFGVISGNAFVLGDLLTSSQPGFFSNTLDFADDPFTTGVDEPLLTAGGQEILTAGGSGGSALLSEVFAFEVLGRCEGAVLLKTEQEIIYTNPAGKKADFLVQIDGVKIGVTVTRAVTYPFGTPLSAAAAGSLISKKLNDILASSANVAAADAWRKQVLSIIAYDSAYISVLATAWENLDASVKADTILYVTATMGNDSFIYQ